MEESIRIKIENALRLVGKKQALYFKAETKLSNEANGFIDKEVIDNFRKAKIEWQLAMNKYNEMISIIANKEV